MYRPTITWRGEHFLYPGKLNFVDEHIIGAQTETKRPPS